MTTIDTARDTGSGGRVRAAVVPVQPVSTEGRTADLAPTSQHGEASTVNPSRWERRYALSLVGLDALAMLAGGTAALYGRFGELDATHPRGVHYYLFALAFVPMWVLIMAASKAYEPRFLGVGSEEFRRVGNAATRFTALIAVLAYAFKFDIARGFVGVALPVAAALALLLRYAARKVLHHARAEGAASHRVLVIGSGPSAEALVTKLRANPHAGLRVVGAVVPGGRRADSFGDGSVPVVSSLSNFMTAVRRANADTVAVAHSPGITPDVLRRLSWELEGSGVDLMVAPALTDVAGPRIHVRPVSGLPLLQVDEPEFRGMRRIVKGTIDRLGATGLLLLLLPILAATALAIRVTSDGPIIFRQVRVGRGGRHFTLYKFRTMLKDAETRRFDITHLNEHADGVLFKIRHDPRVTPLGRHLRRYSIDELPQLINVVFGQMSLVGPRPPLPTEVAQYELDVHRRLLVKPGLTGLWQVSGRSNLQWSESVQLDLYYVENWSVAMDAEILWKTVSAVVRGSGAY